MISIQELVDAIIIQFEALGMVKDQDYKIMPSSHKLRLECDMYLLGGALANLAMTCRLETIGDMMRRSNLFSPSRRTSSTSTSRKRERNYPMRTLATFGRWHQHPDRSIDPNTAMLILAERVAMLHHGQFVVGTPSTSGLLVDLSLPARQPSAP